MDGQVRRFDDLAAEMRAKPGRLRLVGIDGCGGAGKTTFATRLSAALGDVPVVHTDDFASHDVPIDWWPRLLTEVIEPLLRGEPASYRPYDWVARRFADEVLIVAPAAVVLIEGVGATRRAWRDRLITSIWVDCPRDLRLARGLARDGEAMREFWLDWIAAEDAYVRADRPWIDADIVVDGAATAPDPENEYVVLPELSAPR